MTLNRQRSVKHERSYRLNIKLNPDNAFDVSIKFRPAFSSIFTLALALVLTFGWISAGSAQDEPGTISLIRTLQADDTGQQQPAGLAYSPKANTFYVLEAQVEGQPAAATAIGRFDPLAGPLAPAQLAAPLANPHNLAFDPKGDRLLFLQGDRLMAVAENPAGELSMRELVRLSLQDPQGMSVDPASGRLFILDAAAPQLLSLSPSAAGGFDASTQSAVKLAAPGLSAARSLAFDPSSGSLHLLSGMRLFEFSQAGELLASRDLTEFGLAEPQGMVFAPSGDQTDDPQELSLYLADGSQIYEFSFTPPVVPATVSFTSALVRTTNLGAISPPSPDTSGIGYYPPAKRLIAVDGEVEEVVNGITHFQGANVWELTLGGSVLRTANISTVAPTFVPMTDEPTGITWNPSNGHFFVSNDGLQRVYDLNPGADGLIGTPGDTWTHFVTSSVGNTDPEGIAFDTWNNRLFVADGVNREVYQYTLSGTMIGHFDVEVFGIVDPESVEFNPVNGTLFVMSSNPNNRLIVETTTDGVLLQTIDISAVSSKQAAGLALAPASDGSNVTRFYIVDRGIDNDSDPYAVDGKMYEMTSPVQNEPPSAGDDSASAIEATPVTFNVANNDSDPDGNLVEASANTDCQTGCSSPDHGSLVNTGDASFEYTPDPGFTGSDSFIYEICDIGYLCVNAAVNIQVSPANNPPVAVADSTSTNEDVQTTIPVAANDTDPDGNLDPASSNTDCPSCSLPGHGALVNNPNGTFTYTPAPNFNGIDDFIYEICDLGSPVMCDTAAVSITVAAVNDPPVANDFTVNTAEDRPRTFPVAFNDPDGNQDLDPDSLNTDCGRCSPPLHGSLDNNHDGTMTYLPFQDFNGSDSFVYEICDVTGACDTGRVTINISPVPDPPAANDDQLNTTKATPGTIDVAANDSDPEGDLIRASANADCQDCTLPAYGILDNNYDGTFTYRPSLNFTGTDSFIYQICDSGARCDIAFVLIKVDQTVKYFNFLPVTINGR